MKRNMTKWAILGLAILAFVQFPAVSQKATKIGYSNMQMKEDFFIIVERGLSAEAKKAGYVFEETIADRDATKMKQNIEALVTKGANLIVDFNVLPEVGSAIAADLKKQGIPMLSIDCLYQDAYFFGVNNLGAGRILGDFAVDQLKKKFGNVDFVVNLYDAASGPEVKKRCDGVVEKVQAAYKLTDSQIVWLDSKADDVKTKTMTTDWLNSHPKAKKILFIGQNDDRGYAINTAVNAAGRVNDCLIVSHNADPSSIENLQKGKKSAWVGTASYNSFTYGQQIIDMVGKILKGDKVDQSVYTKVTIVSADNVAQYVKDRDATIAANAAK
jgi:ABC-type sugar transport system substrate-binding protein